MLTLNKIFLAGNVGRCEVRTFQEGKVANITLAVNERYTKRDGEKVENTTWFDLVANGKLADIAEQYIEKGTPIVVEGRVRQREYTTREGDTRRVWEVMVQALQLNGSKPEKEEAPAEAPAGPVRPLRRRHIPGEEPAPSASPVPPPPPDDPKLRELLGPDEGEPANDDLPL